MHAIKKAARREAWYNHDPENRSLFGTLVERHNPSQQRRIPDEEEGTTRSFQHRNSETAAGPTPAESRRRENDRPLSGVSKSGTFPRGSKDDVEMPEKRFERELASSGGDATSRVGSEKPLTEGAPRGPEERSRESYQSPGSSEDNAGPRKRNVKALLTPWRKSEDPGPEDVPNRTATTDSKKRQPKLTLVGQVKAVFGSWINLLLIFVPIGIALHYVHSVDRVVVFVINFLAIIPLAAVLSFATEELAMYIGETLGGLLNATFGNAVELIVSIIALAQGKILIVQTSLIGSMLSNLLLVLGMSFFLGGVRRTEQYVFSQPGEDASHALTPNPSDSSTSP